MPQIKLYQQQTENVGPVNVQRAQPSDFGAQAGQELYRVGEDVGQLGQVIHERQVQSEVSDLNAKFAKAHADLTVKYKQELDAGTLKTEDFMKEVSAVTEQVQEGATTRGAQLYYKKQTAILNGHFLEASAAGQATIAGDRAINDFKQGLQLRSSTLINDPSSFGVAQAQQYDAIDALVASGALPATKAEELKMKSDSDLAESSLRGWMRLNPSLAEEKLNSGEFDSYFTGDVKHQLQGEVKQAKTAELVEAERLKKQEKELKTQQQQITQDKFLQKYDSGLLTSKDVLQSNLEPFGSGSKETFLNMIKVQNRESKAKLNQSDPYLYKDLMDRIHLPDGDPNKLTDENELYDFFGPGRINTRDLKNLRNEMQGKGTIKGQADMNLRNNLRKMGRDAIAKPDPFTKIPDPKAMQRFMEWDAAVSEAYSAAIAEGKTPRQLTTPGSPDYLGDKFPVSQYQSTLEEAIQNNMEKINKPKSVIQKGQTYILNPKTGKYE